MMNSNGKRFPSDDRLLQEMMPKLGLKASVPKEQYKNKTRVRYFLSKVLAVCLAVLAVGAIALLLTLPVRISDVKMTARYDQADVEFHVDRRLLFESVTATLDSRPLIVMPLADGRYHVEVEKNGELTVVARTFTGRSTVLSLPVDCIDDDPPFVQEDHLSEGYIYVYLSDGDGGGCSGINWDSVRVTYIDSGGTVAGVETDESGGYVRLPLPDVSVRIYLEDNNGNPLSLRLDRPQSGG